MVTKTFSECCFDVEKNYLQASNFEKFELYGIFKKNGFHAATDVAAFAKLMLCSGHPEVSPEFEIEFDNIRKQLKELSQKVTSRQIEPVKGGVFDECSGEVGSLD